MDDTFNPYAAWLGLDPRLADPDHYQLLGVHPTATQHQIRAAADAAVSRVRSLEPGSHGPRRSRLLDEILLARQTLANPHLREQYDRRQASGTGGRLTTGHEQDASEFSIPFAIPFPEPTGAPDSPATREVPTPSALPLDHSAESAPPATPDSVYPSDVAQDPMAPLIPVGTPVPPVQDEPAHQPPGGPVVGGISSGRAAARRRSRKSPLDVVLAVTGVLTLFVVALVIYAGQSDAGRSSNASSTSSRAASSPALSDRGDSSRTHRLKDGNESVGDARRPPATRDSSDSVPSRPSIPRELATDDDPVARAIGIVPSESQGQSETTNSRATEEPESGESMESATEPASMKAPNPSMSKSETATSAVESSSTGGQSAKELASLGRALSAARSALSVQDFDTADRELAAAERLARSPEHLAMVERLRLLGDYAQQYQRGIQQAIDRLDAGDMIRLRDDVDVGVVEVSPESLTLRVAGRNKSYRRSALPSVLSRALAESWFDESLPGSLIAKGTYLLLDERGDAPSRETGRRYWQRAAEQGVDVADLLRAIDDDYDLAGNSVRP